MVSYGFSHRWELGFWKESWKGIKLLWDVYINKVKECDFKECELDKRFIRKQWKI